MPAGRGGKKSAKASAMIDALDKKVIQLLQGDLPVHPKPFALLAEQLGITEHEFIARIRSLKEKGVIRRFGATLRHQEAGFSSNAMVAWKVPEERVKDVGKTLAAFREVTHCYQRPADKRWPYNLYTMIHGDDEDQCYRIARRMSEEVGVDAYVLLFSEKEFKKTSMEYF
jgi:DNA-binding Lrp family transcriptional regulator